MTHVSMLEIRPHSTLEKPWRFQSLIEAMEFCRTINRPFYCAIVDDSSRYQIWPGGRIHEYREHVLKAILDRNSKSRLRRGVAPDGTQKR
jgi:hypothetical protein